jgi:hypothetical protein
MEPAQGRPPKRRRRPLVRVALALLLIVLVGVSWLGYEWHRAARDRREAEAEADRLDPGWRLADLEAARATVPDEENSALQVRAAYRLLPGGCLTASSSGTDLSAHIAELPPAARLNNEQREGLRKCLAKVAPALEKARRVTEMPHGRYPIVWSPDGIGTPMPQIVEAREITGCLYLDAVARADAGAIDDAIDACRAILNVGRSFGDEPACASPVVRTVYCRFAAVAALERALGHGEAREAALRDLQGLLEDEVTQPLQLVAARAQRANFDLCLRVIEAGEFNRAYYGRLVQSGWGVLDDRRDRLRARTCHASYLRYLNECVEIAKLPPEVQAGRVSRVERMRPEKVPIILEVLARGGDYGKLALDFHCDLARLRCALAGVAAERYRLENGRWPDRLEDLVPHYLSAVPADPVDGQPLRYRRTEQGVVIHTLDFGEARPGDTGDEKFRLFDPAHRGRVSAAKGAEKPGAAD